MATGRINLKRDAVAGSEEGMTPDYRVTFRTSNEAIVEDEDSTHDHVLKRLDKGTKPPTQKEDM